MFCKYCGKEIADGSSFCGFCGKNLVGQYSQEDMEIEIGEEPEEKTGKRKKKRLIAVISACAMIFFVIAAVILLFSLLKKDGKEALADASGEEAIKLPAVEAPKIPVEEPKEGIAEEPKQDLDLPAEDLEVLDLDDLAIRVIGEEQKEEAWSEYLLPDSANTYLTREDLTGLSSEQLRLARNEIYARHGRIFKDDDLRAYFESKSWYAPSVEEVADSELNSYERANRDLIVEMENGRTIFLTVDLCIEQFEVSDGNLVIRTDPEDVQQLDVWSYKETFFRAEKGFVSISDFNCPLAEGCIWGSTGLDTPDPDGIWNNYSYRELKKRIDNNRGYYKGDGEILSPVLVCAVVENGEVTKVYMIYS